MLVVLLGLAVLSLVTVSVAAMFVEMEEQQIERDLMHEIKALRVEVSRLRDELREIWSSGTTPAPATGSGLGGQAGLGERSVGGSGPGAGAEPSCVQVRRC